MLVVHTLSAFFLSNEVWWRLLQHGVVGVGGHGWPMKQGTASLCGWQYAAALSHATQALQLREHDFWTCKGLLEDGRLHEKCAEDAAV